MENQSLKKPTPRVALWQQQAELLAHLCQFSKNVLCVVAPHNSGKTEFIQYFLDLPLPRLYKQALYSEQKTVDAMMQEIAQRFNLPWDKQSAQPLQRETDNIAQHQESTWVLLVDDADFMSPECLKAVLQLSQTDLEPRRQLHIILFGQPELEQILAQDEFQSIIKGHSHTLELAQASMSTVKRAATIPSDTKKNTLDDLDEDGLFEPQSDPIYQEPVSRKITKPHGVNMATKTLSFERTRQMLVHPMTLGALAGVGLGIIYLSLNPMDDAEWQDPPTHAAQLAEVNWDTTSQPLNIKVLSASKEAMTNASAVQKESATTQGNADQASILATDNNSNVAPTAAVVSDIAADKTVTVSKTAAAAVQIDAPTAAASKQANAKPAAKTLLSAENTLLSANAKFYTLQLMGGKNQASIKQFIDTHKIADKAYTYRKRVKGDLWYVVVLGQYPSKESAQKAIQTLPPALRQGVKPWVRTIESVQKEINSAQG